jgi:hypothetical protein
MTSEWFLEAHRDTPTFRSSTENRFRYLSVKESRLAAERFSHVSKSNVFEVVGHRPFSNAWSDAKKQKPGVLNDELVDVGYAASSNSAITARSG